MLRISNASAVDTSPDTIASPRSFMYRFSVVVDGINSTPFIFRVAFTLYYLMNRFPHPRRLGELPSCALIIFFLCKHNNYSYHHNGKHNKPKISIDDINVIHQNIERDI